MGIQLFSDDKTASPNPDPKKFTILDLKEYPGDEIITVVKVYYPGCTTHGGNKILVFEASEEEIRGRAELDPHFIGLRGPRPDRQVPRHQAGLGGRGAVRRVEDGIAALDKFPDYAV